MSLALSNQKLDLILAKGDYDQLAFAKLSYHTLSTVRVGQLQWDDIKIWGHQLGHLISKF